MLDLDCTQIFKKVCDFMKKKKGLIVISIVTLVAICSSVYLVINSQTKVEPINPINKVEQSTINSDFEGGSIYCGYLSSTFNVKCIANTYEEFTDFCEKHNTYAYDGYGNIVKESGKLNSLIEKYDKKFFEHKSLALVYVPTNSGSNYIEFIGAAKENNSVKIHYQVVYPKSGIGTCDMSGYIVFAEIDKDITNII